MDPFATPSDVEAIWRPLTPNEEMLAYNRAMQASRLIRREVPLVKGLTVDQRITAGTLTADDVKDVAAEMVKRTFTLPEFVRQQSVSVDDGSQSNTIDSSVSDKGGVFLTDAELQTLSGRRGGRKATTVPLSGGRRWDRCSPWT